MELSEAFPIWDQLTSAQQEALQSGAVLRSVPRGTVLSRGGDECTGLMLVRSGQLRAYILSEEGREVTPIPAVRPGPVSLLRLLRHAEHPV